MCATDLGRLPPTFVVTAEYDPLYNDGFDYAQKLRDAVQLLEIGEVSPLELIDAALARIEQMDGGGEYPADPLPGARAGAGPHRRTSVAGSAGCRSRSRT